ncbi:MAG TPA: hypothetical protein VFO58_05080 [Vicinamibacterales bacterium]|nr:hypothetical protein [Vicinamibacterales bacterium]
MKHALTCTIRLAVALACMAAPACENNSGPSSVETAAQVQGTWTGEYTVSACNDQSVPGFCGSFVPVGTVLPIQFVLTQSGQSLSGTVELGAFSVPVSGTINGSRIVLSGSGTVPIEGFSTTVTLSNWNTAVSGLNMTGTWRTTFSIAGFPGSAFIDSTIRVVTKTA